MPELPEVEIVKRALEPVMVGRRVERLVFHRRNLRFPLPQDLPERICGQRFQSVSRRGKYILAFAENGYGFVLHLGMSGVIRIELSPEDRRYEKHDHVELLMEGGVRIVFNDSRRFGFIEALEEKSWQIYPPFAKMGPEPLNGSFGGFALAVAFKGKRCAIKNALLDQKIVAGIGNIYACEALYMARIDPHRAAQDLSADECEKLSEAIQNVLSAAIEAGGSSLKDYKHADGKLGYFQHHFAVYDRAGEACGACGCDTVNTGGVCRVVQGGRSTFYCPVRQI